MKTSKHTVNMCEGPLFGKLVRYAVPLGLTGLLQIAFNAADMAVIGRFGSARSMAGIGAIGELSWLLVCVVIGISTGSNVVAAQMFGAKDHRGLHRVVHTSLAFALASGFSLLAIGQILLPFALKWIQVPDDIYHLSLRYLRICFCGLPCTMITNFSLSILRGVGDSRRPLYFLIQGSAVNLCLNIVFVKYLKLDVGGVAFATVLSQLLTTTMCVTALFRERSDARLLPKNIRFYRAELKRILWIGIPSGLQFACYALANTIIQSAINTLGSTAIAGNTAAMIVEMALHTWTGAIFQTIMTAVGQNYGAGEYRRVVRCILLCLMIVTTSITVLGHLTVRNGEVLLGLINDDPGVIACGMTRVRINLSAYALIATMDALSGALRGLGRSITPTVATLVGACGLRIVWVATVFPRIPTLEALFAVFPLSWICVSLVNGAILFLVCRAMLSGRADSRVLKILR